MPLAPFFERLSAGQHLSIEEAHASMCVLLTGRASPPDIAAFLLALKNKGETEIELAGFVRAMREHMTRVEVGDDLSSRTIDIVGTGGDAGGTFNISTVTAFVLAGAGAYVAKHGNRAISGKAGSADVLAALGIRIAMTPQEAAQAVREFGLGFLFAPYLHPAFKHVQAVRRELKVRTVFNLLGPLANPASVQRQVIGAPSPQFAEIMANALGILGTIRSFVVSGGVSGSSSELDEISTAGPTEVWEVRNNKVVRHRWMPSDFGLGLTNLSQLAGGDAAENAVIARAILEGRTGPHRDIVLANAAVGLVAAGLAGSIGEGMALAKEAIDSKKALAVLKNLQKSFPAN